MLGNARKRPIIALAALTVLLLSGCAGPDAQTTGAITIAPGTTAHVLLNVSAAGSGSASSVQVDDDAGLTLHLPETLHDGAGQVAAWVGVEVPADASPGEREVVLDVQAAGETRRVVIPVTVEVPSEPLGEGTVAVVDLTFHARDGTVAMTTRADVHASPLPRTDDYQPPQAGPQSIPVSAQQLPPEIFEPLAAAGVGHSLTIEMAEFYGPVQLEQERPREEVVARTEGLERYVEMPRAQAEQSGFITPDTQEGDALQVGGPIPYVVETLDETTFRAEVDLQEGDAVAWHDPWPEATFVDEVGPQDVFLRTDPPVDIGEPFTWDPSWPDATEVAQLDDDEITLRHTPSEGLSYTQNTQQGAVETTVTEVGEENITVSQQNPHPLAGQTILIDITVTGEEEAPQQQVPVG